MATTNNTTSYEAVVAPHTENIEIRVRSSPARMGNRRIRPHSVADPILDREHFYSRILEEQMRGINLMGQDYDVSKPKNIFLNITHNEIKLAIAHNISLLQLKEKQRTAFKFYRDLYLDIFDYVQARILIGPEELNIKYETQEYWKSIVDEQACCPTYREGRMISRLVAFRQLRRFMPDRSQQGLGLDLEEYAAMDSPILNNDEPCAQEKYNFPLINMMQRVTHFPNKLDTSCIDFLAEMFENEEVLAELTVKENMKRDLRLKQEENFMDIETQAGFDDIPRTQIGFSNPITNMNTKIEETNARANTMMDNVESGVSGFLETAKSNMQALKERCDAFANGFFEKAKNLGSFAKKAVEGIAHIIIGIGFALVTGKVEHLLQSFVHYALTLDVKMSDIATFISGLLGKAYHGVSAKFTQLKEWIAPGDKGKEEGLADGAIPAGAPPRPPRRHEVKSEAEKLRKANLDTMVDKLHTLTEEYKTLASLDTPESNTKRAFLEREIATYQANVEGGLDKILEPVYTMNKRVWDEAEAPEPEEKYIPTTEEIASAPPLELIWPKYDNRKPEVKAEEELNLDKELKAMREYNSQGFGLIAIEKDETDEGGHVIKTRTQYRRYNPDEIDIEDFVDASNTFQPHCQMGFDDQYVTDNTYVDVPGSQPPEETTEEEEPSYYQQFKEYSGKQVNRLAGAVGYVKTNPRQKFGAACDRGRGVSIAGKAKNAVKSIASNAWSWLSDNPLVNLFPGMITFAMTMMIGGERFKPMKLLKTIGDIGRSFKGVDDMIRCFSRFWGWCRDKAYTYAFGKNYEECSLEAKYPKLKSVMAIGNFFVGLKGINVILQQNKKVAFIFLQNFNLASQYAIKAAENGDRNIHLALTTMNNKFKEHIGIADRAVSTRGGQRPEPVIVGFRGKPGSGKTVATHQLIKDLCEQVYPGKDKNTLVHHRKPENGYWDGISANCMVVCLDDFGQVPSVAGQPINEYLEVIRLGNSDEMQLHMSAVVDKSGTFARPEFCFLSTNQTSYSSNNIVDIDAFLRRLNFDVTVTMKPEFTRFIPYLKNRTADPFAILRHVKGKDWTDQDILKYMNSEEYVEVICMDVYQFSFPQWDEEKKEVVDMCVGYKDFLEMLKKKNRTYKRRFATEVKESKPDEVPEELKRFVEVNAEEQVTILHSGVPDAFYSKFIDVFANNFTKLFTGHYLISAVATIVSTVTVALPRMLQGLVTVADSILGNVMKFVKEHWLVLGLVLTACGAVFYKNVRKCEFKEALSQPNFLKLFSARTCGEYGGMQLMPTKMLGCEFCYNYLSHARPILNWYEEGEVMKFNQSDFKNYIEFCAGLVDFDINTQLMLAVYTNVPGGWFSVSTAALPASDELGHGPDMVEAIATESGKSKNRIISESYQARKPRAPRLTHCSQPVCHAGFDDPAMGNITTELLSDREAQGILSVPPIIETQSAIDNNAVEVMRKVITKNMVILNAGDGHFVHATVLRANFILVNKHFANGLKTVHVANVFGETVYTEYKVIARHDMTRRGNEVDFCVIALDKTFNHREDMTRYFISRSDTPKLSSHLERGCVRMISSTKMEIGRKNQRVPMIESLSEPQLIANVEPYDDNRKQYFKLVDVLYGNCNSMKGTCGALMMCFRPGLPHKFISVHAAGDKNGVAFSQIFTQEDFEFLKEDVTVINSLETQSGILEDVNNVTHLGQIEQGGSWMKSHIEPSCLYGTFAVKTTPADLHPDRLIPNLLKVTKPTVRLSDQFLDISANNVFATLSSGKKHYCRVLTDEEAIQGIQSEPYISGINRATSAGYPYMKLTRGLPGKTKFLGNDQWITNDPLIRGKMEKMEMNAALGVMDLGEGIFMASLKDETRPFEKVDAGKTRVFSSANIVLTLVIRKYFLGFMDHVMRNRIINEIGLGMNVYGNDWNLLIKKLNGAGNQIIAGDFSNFDGSLNAQILFRIVDVINRWYDDEHTRTREILFRYLVHSVWLVNGKLIQLNHSQPSGNPLTTLINCMYNMFIFRYNYLALMQINRMIPTLVNYNFFVRGVYYGDDSIISVAMPIIGWFNQETITQMMAETGHEYTDETKKISTRAFKLLDEVTFLKRSFRELRGRKVAALDKNTITEMVMWKRDGLSEQEAMKQTTRHAGFEAFLHGSDYFNWFTKTVNKNLDSMGIQTGILTHWEYEDFSNEFVDTITGDTLLLDEMLMAEC